MPNNPGTSTAMKKKRNALGRPVLVSASIAALALGPWAALTVPAQSNSQATSEGNALPPATGEPLTIKPVDMQDVDCTIAQWDTKASRPTLTIICPPETIFAPLRVLIKLSWMKPELVPADPGKIPFRPGALTKIRTNKEAAQIWLLAGRDHGAHEEWVAFDAVGDIALLTGRTNIKSPKKASSSLDPSQSRIASTQTRNAMTNHSHY